jgi:probable F420-dependent oxidoreductase
MRAFADLRGASYARRVRVGIITPVVTLLPGAHARWERTGTIDDVVEIARAADRLGFDHLTCSEHAVVPTAVADQRGGRYWDPSVTLGYLAACTERIRLATSVVVLGYHHPLTLAKRYATLDHVSGGRLVLGVGVGSLREEFELLGAPFDDRGARADDAIAAVRAALSDERPAYYGEYTTFDDVVMDPTARQARVPIWVGGRTGRSLRRAVELADGWCPFGLTAAEVTAMLASARDTAAWSARTEPLDVVLQPTRALDPAGAPDAARASLDELVAAGATAVALRLVHHSPAHYVEQLEGTADLVGPLDPPRPTPAA